jgi:hypothetical protein
MLKSLAVAAATAALVTGGLGAGMAQAESAPGCSSTIQIGSTAYIKFQGQEIASVKQFKGCNKNWGYIYVWDSFRKRGLDWYLLAAVDVDPGPRNYYQGGTTNVDSVTELWSTGTDTLSKCTAGYGLISIVGYDHYSAMTDTRC